MMCTLLASLVAVHWLPTSEFNEMQFAKFFLYPRSDMYVCLAACDYGHIDSARLASIQYTYMKALYKSNHSV